MKRFMLFAGDKYYPTGGMMDFVGYFDTQDEAVAYATTPTGQFNSCPNWFHIYDTVTGQTYDPDR